MTKGRLAVKQFLVHKHEHDGDEPALHLHVVTYDGCVPPCTDQHTYALDGPGDVDRLVSTVLHAVEERITDILLRTLRRHGIDPRETPQDNAKRLTDLIAAGFDSGGGRHEHREENA